MHRLTLPSLFLFCLLLVSGCAASKKAKEAARQAAAKEAAENKQAADLAEASTAEQKLGVLVQAYPELLGKTTRVITRVDTVVIKEATAAATIPVLSTAATDTALVNSLLQQLARAGQLVNKAQANAIQRSLLPELAKRPLLSRDTARTQQGGLAIKAWVDATGAVQIRTTRQTQRVGYPAAIWDIRPQPVVVQHLGWYEKLVVAAKAYGWLLLLLLFLACFFLVRSIYRANTK